MTKTEKDVWWFVGAVVLLIYVLYRQGKQWTAAQPGGATSTMQTCTANDGTTFSWPRSWPCPHADTATGDLATWGRSNI